MKAATLSAFVAAGGLGARCESRTHECRICDPVPWPLGDARRSLEREERFELSNRVWKTRMFPATSLPPVGNWNSRQDSNPRPRRSKHRALPLSYGSEKFGASCRSRTDVSDMASRCPQILLDERCGWSGWTESNCHHEFPGLGCLCRYTTSRLKNLVRQQGPRTMTPPLKRQVLYPV